MNISEWLSDEELKEVTFLLTVLKTGATRSSIDNDLAGDGSINKLPAGDEYQYFNECLSHLIVLAHERYCASWKKGE